MTLKRNHERSPHADLDRAGTAYKTRDGYFDFHATRHGAITSGSQVMRLNVLKEFARIGRELFRGSDIFGRWGGEEFLVVLPGVGSAHARQMLDTIRLGVASHGETSGRAQLLLMDAAADPAFGEVSHVPREEMLAIANEASTMCPFFSPSRPVSFSAHPVAISTPQDKVAHIRT